MNKGIYLVLVTALISGFSVFSNRIFVTNTDPLVFTTVKNALAGVLLTVILVSSGKHKSLKFIKKSDWVKLGIIGILGGGIAFALFFIGLSKIGAVQGNLIHKTLFLWVALLALPVLGERPTLTQIVGYGFILLGTFVIAGPAAFTFNSGSLLVLSATVLWAVENIIAKITLPHVSAHVVGWLRILIGIPVLLFIAVIIGKGELFLAPKTYAIWPLLTSSLFLTGYVVTWYKGLKLIPATTATSILVLAPVVTTVLTNLWLTHTSIFIPQNRVLLLVILGVLLVAVKLKRPQTPVSI